MPRQNFMDITIILDRSGSMHSIKDATIKGINDFITEQRSVPGDGCWSLVQFDDQYEVVYSGKNEKEAPLLNGDTFLPRGSTALIDAVCRTIDETGERLKSLPEEDRPSKVLMVIMTDGLENSSTRFTRQELNEKISHQRDKYGWGFMFLGANQDAIATAASYGIPTGSALTYAANPHGTRMACRATSKGTRQWKLDGNTTADNLITDPGDEDQTGEKEVVNS